MLFMTSTVSKATLADEIRRAYSREQARRYRENNPEGYRANRLRYYCRTLERAGYTVTAPMTSINESEVMEG